MKIKYQDIKLSPDRLKLVQVADAIMNEYAKLGFDLTLRQLYYQFVARGIFGNSVKNYNMIAGVVADGRLAGLLDWEQLVDRTRNLRANRHWAKAQQTVEEAASFFAVDKWKDQPAYVEVWVEKDALLGIVGQACSRLDVPFFSCRGYTSLSEVWAAGQRILSKQKDGKQIHVVHLGDHDPSGIDMSRDIKARLEMFVGGPVHILRAALNRPQIDRYNPPPFPAKVTDSRYETYRQNYGSDSWELDALSPPVLVDIINRAVSMYRDEKIWAESVAREQRGRDKLHLIARNFKSAVEYLKGKVK